LRQFFLNYFEVRILILDIRYFFREIPNWKLILKTIGKFEKEFNDLNG